MAERTLGPLQKQIGELGPSGYPPPKDGTLELKVLACLESVEGELLSVLALIRHLPAAKRT
jgi:hypothetical protein